MSCEGKRMIQLSRSQCFSALRFSFALALRGVAWSILHLGRGLEVSFLRFAMGLGGGFQVHLIGMWEYSVQFLIGSGWKE